MEGYGKMTMPVSPIIFNQYAIDLSNTARYHRGVEQSSWIVSAPLLAMAYTNDARYWAKSAVPSAAKQLSPRREIVPFRHKESLIASSDPTYSQAIWVEAYQQTVIREELSLVFRSD